MNKTRRVTANLPEDLLDRAMEVTGEGITQTIIEGLEQIRRRRAYEKFMALKGKIQLDINIDELRGRNRLR